MIKIFRVIELKCKKKVLVLIQIIYLYIKKVTIPSGIKGDLDSSIKSISLGIAPTSLKLRFIPIISTKEI